MSSTLESEDAEKARVMLGLLESVERDGAQSQRRLASELGIALGLVNAYLKRCIKKGLVKVHEAPAKRYAYYLTPQGFIEKSRLTVDYLSHSFSFFRRAREDCSQIFAEIQAKGGKRVALAGISDFAEISRLSALESGIEIVAIVQPNAMKSVFVGVPVVDSFEAIEGPVDAVMISDLVYSAEAAERAVAYVGADRVFVPNLIRARTDKIKAASKS